MFSELALEWNRNNTSGNGIGADVYKNVNIITIRMFLLMPKNNQNVILDDQDGFLVGTLRDGV